MKAVKLVNSIGLILIIGLIFSLGVTAQEIVPKKRERIAKVQNDLKTNEKVSEEEIKKLDAPESVETQAEQADKKDDKTLRREGETEEEAAIIPYYNNYLKEYRLGPQDVISIEVFGQCPDYCKTAINVPPTAKISYPLIREGVFVGGKTVEQVQEEVRKKLDEYIIDPQVTVTLDKVGSARYSVLGDVGQPGVKLMERRLSVYEAIVESGGILRTGDKKRVTIYRQTQNGITPLAVNMEDIARGKAEMVYLVPGDQVIVPGNKIKTMDKVLDIFSKLSIVRLLFGSPF
ncbi:MAG: polysaccharide biosynthesis/export family protein [Pyrinomonadaceae bacterium]